MQVGDMSRVKEKVVRPLLAELMTIGKFPVLISYQPNAYHYDVQVRSL